MNDREKQIDKLSYHLVNELKKNDYFQKVEKESVVRDIIKEAIMSNLREEAGIDREVKKIMEAYSSQIDKGEVDSRKMFSMIKSKLVKDKGFIT